jgi:hypothetical protein
VKGRDLTKLEWQEKRIKDLQELLDLVSRVTALMSIRA